MQMLRPSSTIRAASRLWPFVTPTVAMVAESVEFGQ